MALFNFRYLLKCTTNVYHTNTLIKKSGFTSLRSIFNTPSHNAYGCHHSCTTASPESKVSHIADIWQLPAQLWSNRIFACWTGHRKTKQGIDYQGILESKLGLQYLMSYLGFSASVYFLYPGLFGQPYIHWAASETEYGKPTSMTPTTTGSDMWYFNPDLQR